MNYTRESKIENLIDVVNFFEYLLYEKKLMFHPDDDFKDYVQNDGRTPSLNSEEVEIFNQLMDQCFIVSEKQNMEIYSIGLASMRRIIKSDVQDPIEIGLLARKRNQDKIYKILEEVNDEFLLSSLEDDCTIFAKEADIVII